MSLVFLAVIGGLTLVVQGFPSVAKIGDTIVEPQAMSFVGDRINGLSFQQDAVITYNGWQYVTYYNACLLYTSDAADE